MINPLKEWFAKREQENRLDDYRRGFSWACYAILAQGKTPLVIQAEYESDFMAEGPKDHFSHGALDATNILVKHSVVEDNRI